MLHGSRGGTWVEVFRQIQRSHITMSSSNWRDSEIGKLRFKGEKVMHWCLTKTGKDGAIYEKDAEDLSLRGFCRDKKQVVRKIKNMVVFLNF